LGLKLKRNCFCGGLWRISMEISVLWCVIDKFGLKFERSAWLLTCFGDILLILGWTGGNQLNFNWTGDCQPEF